MNHLRHAAIAAGILMGACVSAAADAPIAWKFEAGQEADYLVARNQVRAIDFGGNQLEIGNGTKLDLHWKVDSVDEKGNATITANVTRLQIDLTSPIAQFVYDSAGEEPEADAIWEEIGERIKKFAGGEIKMVVAPTGKVEKVEFTQEVVDALQADFNNPQIGRFMGGQFDEKGLSKFVGESFIQLPGRLPSVGETWEKTETQAIPRLGEAVTKRSFKYVGPDGDTGMHRIEITSEVELKEDEDAEEESGGVDLREQEGKGTIEFDASKGRATKMEFVQKMAMDLSRDGNDISIDSTETTTVSEGKSPASESEGSESEQ